MALNRKNLKTENSVSFYATLVTNILFIITSLFFFQLYIDRKGSATLKQMQVGTFITTGLAIILCITFPVRYSSDFIFDLSQIPLWLGSLNGGPIVASGLFLVTSIYGLFSGETSTLSSLIVPTIILAISLTLHKKFDILTPKNRVILTLSLSVFSSLLTSLIMWFSSGSAIIRYTLVYIAIQVLGMFIISYMAEILKLNFALKEQIIKSEKLEMVSHLVASCNRQVIFYTFC